MEIRYNNNAREIKGSEKQVRWAQDIIDRSFDTLDRMDADVERYSFDPGLISWDAESVRDVKEWLAGQLDQIETASQIIDLQKRLHHDSIVKIVKLRAKHGC